MVAHPPGKFKHDSLCMDALTEELAKRRARGLVVESAQFTRHRRRDVDISAAAASAASSGRSVPWPLGLLMLRMLRLAADPLAKSPSTSGPLAIRS